MTNEQKEMFFVKAGQEFHAKGEVEFGNSLKTLARILNTAHAFETTLDMVLFTGWRAAMKNHNIQNKGN
jgi:hypothetical protein